MLRPLLRTSETAIINAGYLARGRDLLVSVVAAALLALALAPGEARACDADSVLDAFEQKIESHRTLRLDYHKEAHSLLFGERPAQDGRVWLGPPRRYRVESEDQTVVRGEDTLWTYSKSTNQVTLRHGDLDKLEFGPVGFFGSLRTDFFAVDCVPTTLNKTKAWKIRLAAKTETAAIQRLTLWIDAKTHLPLASDYVDYNEETTQLTFSDYRLDHPKDQNRFIFVAPEGAERVVLPSVRRSGPSDSEN